MGMLEASPAYARLCPTTPGYTELIRSRSVPSLDAGPSSWRLKVALGERLSEAKMAL